MEIGLILSGLFSVIAAIWFIATLRRVVPTNEVHIVQSGKKTVSYGSNLEKGNIR